MGKLFGVHVFLNSERRHLSVAFLKSLSNLVPDSTFNNHQRALQLLHADTDVMEHSRFIARCLSTLVFLPWLLAFCAKIFAMREVIVKN